MIGNKNHNGRFVGNKTHSIAGAIGSKSRTISSNIPTLNGPHGKIINHSNTNENIYEPKGLQREQDRKPRPFQVEKAKTTEEGNTSQFS